MTAAAFERSEPRRTADRRLLDQLRNQPTTSLALGSFVVLIMVIGQLTSTAVLAALIVVLYLLGMVGLLVQRRATSLQAVAIGSMHLGAAMLLAGTV